MSETTEDAHGFLKGAEFLVNQVLPVQFDLLQTFLPMDCWMVGRHVGDWFDVVATHGQVEGVSTFHLMDSLVDEWTVQEPIGAFRYRAIPERRSGDASGPSCDLKYVFRATLPDRQGKQTGVLAGFLTERELPACEPAHAPVITLCLTAMGHTLNLHSALTAADQLMIAAQKDARIDPLTGVLNRAGWDVEIRKTLRNDAEIAIGFLDLDRLKQINDSMGHLAGDEILRLTARAIKGVIRGKDCVARLGGDEFAVLLCDASLNDAKELTGRLDFALGEHRIEASIGVATRSEAGSVQAALALADQRMYDNKRLRRAQRLTSNVTPFVRPLHRDAS